MSLFRAGLLLLPLFISACSAPTLQQTTSAKTEQSISKQQDTTIASQQVNVPINLENTLDEQIELAKLQYAELNSRSGVEPNMPYIDKEALITKQATIDTIQKLRTYNNQVHRQLTAIDERVEQRKKNGAPGDTIQILVSKTKVAMKDSTFKTQPLIGQWVRGESRIIRLKDSLLFNVQHSEDLLITYSESYQLLVNNKIISIIDPNKSKNHASFNVETTENDGSISGTLDYRTVKGIH